MHATPTAGIEPPEASVKVGILAIGAMVGSAVCECDLLLPKSPLSRVRHPDDWVLRVGGICPDGD